MDDAIERARRAAGAFPTVSRHVERAAALARFEARDRDGPFRREPLSRGVPHPPGGPLFPAFAAIPATPLTQALEALQRELVWAADCAEFTDANLNAAQYLSAAGHLDLAARATLALAGPGLGLVLIPAERVWDLAAGLGLEPSDLSGDMGHLFGPGVSAAYRWDMYHEEPVTDVGPRELVEYRVRFDHGRAACEAAFAGEPRVVAGRRRYGPFFLDDADTDAFTLEWYAKEPDWALPAPAVDAVVARLCAATSLDDLDGGSIELRPALPARDFARALGVPDAFARTVDLHMRSWRLVTQNGDPRVGRWRIEATLDGPLRGDPVPGVTIPAGRAVVLGDEDVVRHLTIADAR